MATILQLPSGRWRAQVRRKQSYASETFLRHEDARKWATATERQIDLGEAPLKRAKVDPTTFAHLIDLHVEDLREVGKVLRRPKRFTLDALKTRLGDVKIKDLTRERLIQFGKDRAKEGAGPVTLSADIGYLKLVLTHAAAVHGINVKVEPVDLASVALKRLGLIGKSRQRDRRPTPDEIKRLLEYFDGNRRLLIPMGRIVRFAIASAMRQEEICRIRWSEVNVEQRIVLVHDRKDPREKDGNDQWVPLLNLGGFDALRQIRVQRKYHPRGDLTFPYNSRSVGTAFRRACRELKIQNLPFEMDERGSVWGGGQLRVNDSHAITVTPAPYHELIRAHCRQARDRSPAITQRENPGTFGTLPTQGLSAIPRIAEALPRVANTTTPTPARTQHSSPCARHFLPPP